MATRTDLKSKAAAKKGQATRKTGEADRSTDASTAARKRAEAATRTAEAQALTAARAVDISLGGFQAAGDRVTEAFRSLRDPRDFVTRTRSDAQEAIDRFEIRGAKTRRKLATNVERDVNKVRERLPV